MLTVKQLLSLFDPNNDLQINLVRNDNSTVFVPFSHFMLERKGFDFYLNATVKALKMEQHEVDGRAIPLLIIECRFGKHCPYETGGSGQYACLLCRSG